MVTTGEIFEKKKSFTEFQNLRHETKLCRSKYVNLLSIRELFYYYILYYYSFFMETEAVSEIGGPHDRDAIKEKK